MNEVYINPKLKPLLECFDPESPYYKYRYLGAKGGRGGGKSHDIAMIILLLCRKYPLKVLVIRQFQNSIKDSNKSLFVSHITKYRMNDFRVKEFEITRNHSDKMSYITFIGLERNIHSIKSYEGFDLVWIEEAQVIKENALQILGPTIRKEHSKIMACWNPHYRDAISDRFKETSISYLADIQYWDNPFFPEVLELERQMHEKTLTRAEYLNIWEGVELAVEPDAIFDADQLYAAFERDEPVDPGDGLWQCGIDLSTFGADKTVFTIRRGNKMIDQKTIDGVTDSMKNYDAFINWFDTNGYPDETKILPDDTGGGNDFSSILKRTVRSNGRVRFPNVVSINFGQKAAEPDLYANAVAEMWYQFRAKLPFVSLKDDRDLLDQLRLRRGWTTIQGGMRRFVLEDKKTFRQRTGKSCDKADSLLLSYYEPMEIAPLLAVSFSF